MDNIYKAVWIISTILGTFILLILIPKKARKEEQTEKKSTEDTAQENLAELMVDSPVTFDTFIGQSLQTRLLKIHVSASQKRKKTVPHILMEGPGGTGKTTLAVCVANEINTRFFLTTPSTFKDKDSVLNFFFDKTGLPKIEEGDVIFIDEIHRLREAAAIYLYSAIQDFYIDVGGEIKTLPKFTAIGATTDSGMLPTPLRDRFKIKLTLNTYLENELSRMVVDFKSIPQEIADMIAQRACGIPRIAKSIADNVIAVADADHDGKVTTSCVKEACFLLNIDENGLNQNARNVIKYFQERENIPAGAMSIANTLNISRETLEQEVYPILFMKGLLDSRGTRGKHLSRKGIEYPIGRSLNET